MSKRTGSYPTLTVGTTGTRVVFQAGVVLLDAEELSLISRSASPSAGLPR